VARFAGVSTTFELELLGTNDAVSGTIWNSLYQQTNEQLAPIDSRRLRLVLSLCYGSAAGIAGFPSLFLSLSLSLALFCPLFRNDHHASLPIPLAALALEKYVIARTCDAFPYAGVGRRYLRQKLPRVFLFSFLLFY